MFARSAFLGLAALFCLSQLLFGPPAAAQAGAPATPPSVSAGIPPSNAQLANPEIEKRVDALLKRMTLEEKLGQLVQYSDTGDDPLNGSSKSASESSKIILAVNPVTANHIDAMKLAATGRLGSLLNLVGQARTNEYQRLAVEKSRLHIPLMFGADVIHGFRTIYPVPLGLAATFDPALVTRLAHMSAEEARTAGVDWFYSPMVDISRDPRWGRTIEGAGEDPVLGAAMAAAYIRGYQGDDISQPGRVAACVKHFAAYGAAEAGREYNTTDMSEIRLRQVYLPPYHAAIKAGAVTIMSAFNALNGVPSTANPFLLHQVLRKEWGFNGFVISDYTAIMELLNHGIALTPSEATEKAITAGVDVDMMSHFYDSQLPGLMRSGKVPMSVVNEAVRRVLRVKFALGLFDHPYTTGPEVTQAVAAHRPLVRRAAEESIVLLQNKDLSTGNPLLPFSSSIKHIALIGPLANDPDDMVDGSGAGNQTDTITVRQALEERAKATGGTLVYVEGTQISGNSTAGFAQAVDAARSADAVVLALGEAAWMSGEAGSRAYLDLPGNQEQLLQAVAATGKPIVLLVFSGRPLVLDWAAAHVPAILESWFPGTEAGHAIANILYGDVSPSGKLPMTFPHAVGQEPLYYAQFPTGRPPRGIDLSRPPDGDSRFFSRYIDVPNSGLFPFGFGLTYSTFAITDVKVSRSALPLANALTHRSGPLLIATATITNTGHREATDVVQCYVRNLGASIEQPVRSLQGFERITLEPGQSKQVSFPLSFHQLSFYNVHAKRTIEATDYTVWIGDSSLATQSAHFKVAAGPASDAP